MQNEREFGILTIDQKGAIVCPCCRRRVRHVRIPPGGELHDVLVQCHDCKTEFIANIDPARATWTIGPRH